MAPGRLFKITALRGSGSIAGTNGGMSSATVLVIVLIVIVIGYLVLEKGGEKGKTTSPNSNPISDGSNHTSRSRQEESNPPPPPLPLDPHAAPDLSESGVPQGTDHPPGSRTIPSPLPSTPSTGGTFGSLSTGLSQASSHFNYPPSPAPTDHSINTEDEEEMDRQRFITEEGLVGGNTSHKITPKPPLVFWMTQYRPILNNERCLNILKGMEEVEDLMAQDWTSLGPGGAGGKAEKANDDQWTPRFGRLPRVITELCDNILASEIIDLAKLAGAMEATENIWESRACAFKDIIMGKEEISYYPVKDGNGNSSTQAVSSGAEKVRDMLLGWFALAYRGYERDQWTDQSDRVRPSEDGNIAGVSGDPGRRTGLALPPAVTAAIDERSQGILLWLAWAGEQYLINRLFTIVGVDLLDATLRAQILPLSPTNSNFKLDVTLFVPESGHLLTLPILESYAHWTLMTPVGPRASPWIEDTAVRCIQWGEKWIREYRRIDESQVDPKQGRITHRRLFVRPGFSNKRVYRDPISATGHRGPATTYYNERSPVLMQLDPSMLVLTRPLTNAKNALSSLINTLRITKIHFVNRRQNKWYTPGEGDCTADRMESQQVAFILSLLEYALKLWYRQDEMRDIHLDLGGMMPYTRQVEGRLGVKFLLIPRVRTYFLPFLTLKEPVQHLPLLEQSRMDKLSGIDDTMKWLTDWSTGIRHSMQFQTLPTVYIIVVKTLDSTDDLLPVHNRLHQAFFDLIIQLFQENPARSADDVAKELDGFIRVMNQYVKLTSVGRCETSVFEPEVMDLEYPASGKALVLKWQAFETAGKGGHPPPPPPLEEARLGEIIEESEPEDDLDPRAGPVESNRNGLSKEARNKHKSNFKNLQPSQEWLREFFEEEAEKRTKMRGDQSDSERQQQLLDQLASYHGGTIREVFDKREALREMAHEWGVEAARREGPVQTQPPYAKFGVAENTLEEWQRLYYTNEAWRPQMLAHEFPWPGKNGKEVIEDVETRNKRNKAAAEAIAKGKAKGWPLIPLHPDPVTGASGRRNKRTTKILPATPPAT